MTKSYFKKSYDILTGFFPFQLVIVGYVLNEMFDVSLESTFYVLIVGFITQIWYWRRIEILTAASVLWLIIFDHQFFIHQNITTDNVIYYWVNRAGYYSSQFNVSDAFFKAAILAVLIFGFLFLTRVILIRKMLSKMWFWVPFYLSSLYFLIQMRSEINTATLLLVGLIVSLGNYIFIIPLYLRSIGDRGPISIESVLNIFPMWARGSIFVWNMPIIRNNEKPELLSLRMSGVKYLINIAIFYQVGLWLQNFIFAKKLIFPGVISFYDLGVTGSVYLTDSRSALWVSVLINALFVIWFEMVCFGGVFCALARFFGVQAFRSVYKPYLALSFADFMSRILFYYNQMIVHLFFFPLYDFFRVLRRYRTLRKTLSIFFAVLIGGLFFHVARDRHVFLNAEFQLTPWTYIVGQLPYVSLIALACCIPTAKLARRSFFWRAVVLMGIFVSYAVIIMLSTSFNSETIFTRIAFLKYLFGLDTLGF